MELKVAKCCGSCLHSNRPKAPREHAAHYEVAKTERWCYKHSCHIIRESCCDDHEGINRASKTNFSRITKFNERAKRVRIIMNVMGNKKITIKLGETKTFFVKDGWLKYEYEGFFNIKPIFVNTKNSSHDKYFEILEKELNIYPDLPF